MQAACAVIFVLTCLVGTVWTTRHYLIHREKRRGRALLTDTAPGPADGSSLPFVSVLVPAKDEAANIERCVRTLLEQDYPRFELVVCNDRSTDDTAAIVERLAAGDPRLRLVTIEHLPDGWCGKCNALQTAIPATAGQWICMIDADCRQTSKRTLSVAVRHALDTGADLLSVLPVLEMHGFWEKVVQPVCGGVMMIWFHPDRVNDPRRRNAYANGAFMLMKRSAYQAVGTHEAVKDRVNEDMHLAALVKAGGLKLRVVRSRGLYFVRMYTSLKEIVRGWGRIFYGTFCTARRLTISLAVILLMGLLPYVAAAVGLGLAASGQAAGWAAWACGIAGLTTAAIQLSVIYRFYRLIGAEPRLAWTYPLGCAVTAASLVLALTKLRKGSRVTWKSTRYASAR